MSAGFGKKLSLLGLGSAALYVTATWLNSPNPEEKHSDKEQNYCWNFEKTTPCNPGDSTKIIARRGEIENEIDVEMIEGVAFPSFFNANRFNNLKERFQFRDGDVVICSHPQSGSKYVEKIISLLLKTNKKTIWAENVEINTEEEENECNNSVAEIKSKERRIFRCHLPWEFFHGKLNGIIPENIKVIYICDNPRDACISQYTSSLDSEDASPEQKGWNFDAFSQAWLSGHLPFGGWFEHILGWEEASNMNDILWCYRGDFRTTFSCELKLIAEHLNIEMTNEIEKDLKIQVSGRKINPCSWKDYFSKNLNRNFIDFVRNQMEESSIREFAF